MFMIMLVFFATLSISLLEQVLAKGGGGGHSSTQSSSKRSGYHPIIVGGLGHGSNNSHMSKKAKIILFSGMSLCHFHQPLTIA
jgi:hypothetical protein